MSREKTLVLGYGNPGRQDDGLGPKLIDRLIEGLGENSNRLSFQSNYQLTVEDAYELQAYSNVIFVDASLNGAEPFMFQTVEPSDQTSLSSHSLSPESVLQLCQTLYDYCPSAYVLGIRGYDFDAFEERLSEGAEKNLDSAYAFIQQKLQPGNCLSHA